MTDATDKVKRYLDFLDAASDWFWETDTEGRVRYMSPGFTAATGYSVEQAIGRKRSELGFVAVDASQEAEVSLALTEGTPFTDVLSSGLMPNGRKIWVMMSGVPVFDDAGNWTGYRGASRDVTARIEAEQAAERNQARLNDFADAAGDWFWEMGPDLRISFMSESVEEFTGRPASWHIGKTRRELADVSADDAVWQQHFADLEQHRPFRDFQFTRQRPDGTQQWLSSSGVPIFDDQGAFQGYRGIGADITARKDAEAQLQEFSSIVRFAGAAIYSSELDGIITSWNPGCEALYGYKAEEMVGHHINTLTAEPEHRSVVADQRQSVIEDGRIVQFETIRWRKDGSQVEISLSLAPIFGDDGKVRGVCGLAQDISMRKRSEAALQDAVERLDAILNTALDGIITIDEQGTVATVNPAAQTLLGYREAELVGQNISRIMPADMARQHDGFIQNYLKTGRGGIIGTGREVEALRADGSTFPADLAISEFQAGGQRMFTGVLRDISDRKAAEEALQLLATTDSLTGLWNRRRLEERVDEELKRRRRFGKGPSLLLLDADYFKQINDTYGHQIGDQVLKYIADTCRETVREVDVAARIGGEEFAVLLPETDLQEAMVVAEKLRIAIGTGSVRCAEGDITVTVSIGAVQAQDAGEARDDLMRAADHALYAAKDAGRNRVVAYEPALDAELSRHATL